jgi:hypothetical protein
MTERESVQAEFIQAVNACGCLKLVAVVSGFALIATRFDTLTLITVPRSFETWRTHGIADVLAEVYERADRQGRFNDQEWFHMKTLEDIYRSWDVKEPVMF